MALIQIPSSTDLAYIAGILDGEGTIDIRPSFTTHKGKKYGPYYIVRLTISNCDMNLMNYLMEKVGGKFYTQRRDNPNHKDVYKWQIFGKNAIYLLEHLIGYMIIKRQHAEIAISGGTLENREMVAALNKRGL